MAQVDDTRPAARRLLIQCVMRHFEHILVATDFKVPAEAALAAASDLASALHAKLTLLHVQFAQGSVNDAVPTAACGQSSERTRPQLEAALSHARRRCRNCEVVIAVGSPAERIVATADDRGVGLIVLGTHGFRGLPDFVLGSVAAEVVRTSSIPVLVVPEPRPSGPGR